MLAIVVNALAVIAGGLIGIGFRKAFKSEILEEVLKAVGLAVIVFGIIGLVREMVYVEGGELKSRHELLLLFSLALGVFLGEALRLHSRFEALGMRLESRLKARNLSKAFVSSTMVFISGAMAIVGSIRAGLGDPGMVYLKAVIDGITAVLLASTLGWGVLLSAISVLIYQGFFALLAICFGDHLSADFISAFGAVGSAILVAVGINFLFKDKMKPLNLVPALAVVIVYYAFKALLAML